MADLRFDNNKYEVKTVVVDDRSVTFRAFEDIWYCMNPVSDVQKLNIYVPEGYYHGESINGYTLDTAPIFVPNTVGGYMQASAMQVGVNRFKKANSAFEALLHGYVVMSAGIRGRNTGMVSKEFFVGSEGKSENTDTKMVGRAPALVVDMKAAIRYLRYNKDVIPGDVEKIITSGTSAGGALSALVGATGNVKDYEPYLRAIGAADEKDDIFAANCYCPIHNLENADMAYEWLFGKEDEFHMMKFERTAEGVKRVPFEGKLSDEQMVISKELKDAFCGYVNSLGLKDEIGNDLVLDSNGDGSFKEYVMSYVKKSATKEKKTHHSENKLSYLAVKGSAIDVQDYLEFNGDSAVGIDCDGFVEKITRMKAVPAFDDLTGHSPENEVFGDEVVMARHFTEIGKKYSKAEIEMADPQIIKLMNPIDYIGVCDTTKNWRIRHGVFDRDTSLAIPVILATLLKNKGFNVDFALPWGLPHSGDYDLEEVFEWIDSLVR